jgi:hypothetical protein
VTGFSDDAPPRRGAVPPPSGAPDDAPEPLNVPRMEPPPPSLEAMVQSGQRSQRSTRGEASNSWLLWIAVVVVAAGITAYVTR